jgi:hypothetical protein
MLIIIGLYTIDISQAVKTVHVRHSSCEYIVSIPEGWDTIPVGVLRERLKSSPFGIDMGIYPLAQTDYFSGNYSLISFTPTVNMLNKFPFAAIVEDIKNMNKSSEIHNDTLHSYFKNIEPVIRDANYFVNSYFHIVNKDVSVKNCQTLHLAKFGYVSVLSYEKEGAVPIATILGQLSDMIQIQEDYKYSFIEKGKGITIRHLLISLSIGLIVYVLITFLQKSKQQQQ